MAPNTLLGLSHILIALIVFLLSIPLAKGKVSRNYLYGIRTAKALESDENWYKINKYGAGQLMIWSIPLALTGLFVLLIPLKNDFFYKIVIWAPLLCIIPAVKCYTHWK